MAADRICAERRNAHSDLLPNRGQDRFILVVGTGKGRARWSMVRNRSDGSLELDSEPHALDATAGAATMTKRLLYRKEMRAGYEWTGFNNMHRATHWMPAPVPPQDAAT